MLLRTLAFFVLTLMVVSAEESDVDPPRPKEINKNKVPISKIVPTREVISGPHNGSFTTTIIEVVEEDSSSPGFNLRSAFAGVRSASRGDVVGHITNPTYNRAGYGNWGTWIGPSYCPEGTWAVGAQQKVEGGQGKGDDTALNSIRLLCAPLGISNRFSHVAEPHFGRWGNLATETYCKESVMKGFDLRTERHQGGGDDTAANSLKIVCSNEAVLELPGGGPWGEWNGEQTCPKGSAVCGVSVQVEDSQGDGDDTALNNVRFACCMMALETSCVPTDQWETITDFHNTHPTIAAKQSYSITTGLTQRVTDTTGGFTTTSKSIEIMAQVGVEFSGIGAKFGTTLGYNSTTGTNWSRMTENAFSTTTHRAIEYTIPPKECVLVQQVIGTCGSSIVNTPRWVLAQC